MSAPTFGPVAAVLARLSNARRSGNGWEASCPAHDDRRASLSVGVGHDGRALLNCHAAAGCTPETIVSALGLSMRDLFADEAEAINSARREAGRTVATYDYVDEEGTLLYQVVRKEPKAFLQRKPSGVGGWSYELNGTRRVLYRLPQLIEAVALHKLIHVVEGEKDVHAVEAKGGVATCNVGGAGKWRPEYSEVLRGASVRIVADRDKPGRKHACEVAAALQGIAASVETVEARTGKDAADHLAAGHGLDDFERFADDEQELVRPAAVSDATLTDTGNASRLAELHGRGLHYIPTWGKWLVERDGFWTVDHRDVLVRELAKDVGRTMRDSAVADIRNADDSVASPHKKLLDFALRSLEAKRIRDLVDLARGIDGIPLDHERLDADGWLLGVENGVVDLRTGTFRMAQPEDLMTLRCPVRWDANAQAPRFERAVEEWHPDPEVRRYVQRVAGSALVGAQRDHALIIHYGAGGNGKGTFVRAIQRVLGPYAVEVHLSLLVETKQREHDTVKADLFRARLAVAAETERRVHLAEASVKNLTGGDRIRARRMHQDSWSFDPTHSLWLQTNHLPAISGRDAGIWRRIRVVKWPNAFHDRAADPTLDETLASEAPGILRWLVEGCQDWQVHGLAEPEAVRRDTHAYRQSEDVFARFVADTGLAFGRGLRIQAAELQSLFIEWAKGEDIKRDGLADWLRDQGARQTREKWTDSESKQRQSRFWNGLGQDVGEEG